MKKMKIAGLLLACALPFTANAADVCLSINSGAMLVKFKKPSVAKGTYTTKLDPILYVPEYGLVGMGSGTIVVHTNGEVDFGLNVSAEGSAPMKNDSELSASMYVARYNVDKKTFTGGAAGSYEEAYIYNEISNESILSTESVVIASVSCKTLPAF